MASVPAGSGVVVNSNDNVEIFDNTIGGNNTANVLISSYFSVTYSGERKLAETFDPYPEGIFIYGNTFSKGGGAPDRPALQALRQAMFGDRRQPAGHRVGRHRERKQIRRGAPAGRASRYASTTARPTSSTWTTRTRTPIRRSTPTRTVANSTNCRPSFCRSRPQRRDPRALDRLPARTDERVRR